MSNISILHLPDLLVFGDILNKLDLIKQGEINHNAALCEFLLCEVSQVLCLKRKLKNLIPFGELTISSVSFDDLLLARCRVHNSDLYVGINLLFEEEILVLLVT